MSAVADIKRFLLCALLRARGLPLSSDILSRAVKEGLSPRPLQSDIDLARHELEDAGYISGATDELDGSTSWALTAKGDIKARQIA